VLAHEAGHHEHRHGLRGVVEQSASLVVVGFLFGDVSGAGALSVSVPIMLLQKGFSREHESEADRFAFARLSEIGVSPEWFAVIMQRMSDHHSGESDDDRGDPPTPGEESDDVHRNDPMGYLDTHPPTPERIAAARAAAIDADMPLPARRALNRKEHSD
jgi:Zn-dependent protease with chaperone function